VYPPYWREPAIRTQTQVKVGTPYIIQYHTYGKKNLFLLRPEKECSSNVSVCNRYHNMCSNHRGHRWAWLYGVGMLWYLLKRRDANWRFPPPCAPPPGHNSIIMFEARLELFPSELLCCKPVFLLSVIVSM
jgi:hypothetical protein